MFLTRLERINKISGFTYIDVISGLTVIIIILGAVFGSIRMMEKSTRKNALIPQIDSFANWIYEEISLRKFDENVESIEENGLTLNFGTEGDESLNDFSTLDDIDDFVGLGLTNGDFPQMEANIIINYVNVDLETSSIIPSVNPTLLKRVKLDITHPSFELPSTYSKIYAGNFDPELLIIRSYPVSIAVDRNSGETNLLEFGSSLTFTVEFSSDVFVLQNDNFEFYIDIKSGVLSGQEGSYNVRPSNIGEVKANYVSGTGTRFLTFSLSNTSELQLSGSNLLDFIGYRPNLIIQNGSVTDIEGNEVIYELPNEDQPSSFASNTNILPMLQENVLAIYTNLETEDFNRELDVQFIPQTARDIFNSWPRQERSKFWINKADLDLNSPDWPHPNLAQWASKRWALYENPDRVNQPQNSYYLNSFLSPDSLENYTFESTLYSSSRDDDVNGLVIAFDNTTPDGFHCQTGGDHESSDCSFSSSPNISRVLHLLIVVRQPMENGGGLAILGPKFSLHQLWLKKHINGSELRSYTSLRSGTSKEVPNDNNWKRWEGTYTRLKIVRNGDEISIWSTEASVNKPDPENPQYHPDPIQINLREDSRTHRFLGKKRIGYTNWSQAGSQYYDNILSGGSLERRDIQIEVDLSTGDVTKYYQKTAGAPIALDVSQIQSDLGYLRPIYNNETRKKYLLMGDRIIEYPFNED